MWPAFSHFPSIIATWIGQSLLSHLSVSTLSDSYSHWSKGLITRGKPTWQLVSGPTVMGASLVQRPYCSESLRNIIDNRNALFWALPLGRNVLKGRLRPLTWSPLLKIRSLVWTRVQYSLLRKDSLQAMFKRRIDSWLEIVEYCCFLTFPNCWIGSPWQRLSHHFSFIHRCHFLGE